MLTREITKKITRTKQKSNRIQVGFVSNDGLDTAIRNLTRRYNGLSIAEIIKLAIVELNNSTLNSTLNSNSNLTMQEQMAINNFESNPETLGVQESKNFTQYLKNLSKE